ncbi:DUF1285 domain-containing protein [Thermodesulforhabdus norvegica]|uniref:DUF1285 domain-containing protein n=1 Tax=Thermodesulforhabdus norvegica TaxID=39841 RepID=A0A1I4VY80_9BACT|nr:DUF1285 domain-containing protein [Thermodesulforhabdus norvegica]SFN06100.1 hypothetical protein SAMN05660836_02515 [Thermodesulforhabdus norvegica]
MNGKAHNVPEDLPPCGIKVDSEGNWFYEGRPIIREDILKLFYSNLHFSREKGFWIEWQGKACTLDVEDTPYVVIDVEKKEQPGGNEYFLLRLRHIKETEQLDPRTLFVGRGNVLYCKIKGGEVKARFSRPAYYRLAKWIEEDNGTFYVCLNGKRYNIAYGDL